MKKLITLLIAIVLGLALFPTIIDATENYDITTAVETFTATELISVAEVLTTSETIVAITGITVEGVALDLETEMTSATGTTVTLVASASETGDEIIITYTYEMDVAVGIDGLVSLMPILFATLLVVGIVVAIKFK